jgi:hypothetical protein
MTTSKRRTSALKLTETENELVESAELEPETPAEETIEPSDPLPPTGKIFLGEEDKRILKKFNKHIVNKLGLGGNRSFKI